MLARTLDWRCLKWQTSIRWRKLAHELIDKADAFFLLMIVDGEEGTTSMFPVREGTDDRRQLLDLCEALATLGRES